MNKGSLSQMERQFSTIQLGLKKSLQKKADGRFQGVKFPIYLDLPTFQPLQKASTSSNQTVDRVNFRAEKYCHRSEYGFLRMTSDLLFAEMLRNKIGI